MEESKRQEWIFDDDVTKIKVINEREMTLFKLDHISEFFGYTSEIVRHFLKKHIEKRSDGVNATFVFTDDGLYCSVLIPLLLSRTALIDERLDKNTIVKRMGWLGRIVEETMNDGDGAIYMYAMTKAANKLLKEAFGW